MTAGDSAFASGPAFPYIGGMAIFPRPVSPKSAMSDLWSYFRENRPHKWPLLGLSVAFTWVIIWAFIVDANTNTLPTRNQLFYALRRAPCREGACTSVFILVARVPFKTKKN